MMMMMMMMMMLLAVHDALKLSVDIQKSIFY
jgi:hypothetical protein